MTAATDRMVAVKLADLENWSYLLSYGIRAQEQYARCCVFFGHGDEEECPALELLGGFDDYLVED